MHTNKFDSTLFERCVPAGLGLKLVLRDRILPFNPDAAHDYKTKSRDPSGPEIARLDLADHDMLHCAMVVFLAIRSDCL